MRSAQARLDVDGLVVDGERGGVKAHPLAQLLPSLATKISSLSATLRITETGAAPGKESDKQDGSPWA
jgi:hypothetical protein